MIDIGKLVKSSELWWVTETLPKVSVINVKFSRISKSKNSGGDIVLVKIIDTLPIFEDIEHHIEPKFLFFSKIEADIYKILILKDRIIKNRKSTLTVDELACMKIFESYLNDYPDIVLRCI